MQNNLQIEKPKILIVDDISTNVDILMQALEPEGYNIAVVQTGEKAVEVVPKLKPDIILMDVMMPGIDGFEACRQIKKIDSVKDIPVIFITARNDATDLVEGFRSGGVDYIAKPFKFEEVNARVRAHCQNRILMRQVEYAMQEAIKANEQFKSAQSQLVQSEKMASLGAMISGIGHEINNPCNFIINNLHGLTKSVDKVHDVINEILSGDPEGERVAAFINPNFDKAKESIALIKEGADRIADIVKSLRTFARSEGTLQDVDVNEVIKSTLRIMSHMLTKIEFVQEYGQLTFVECAPARLGQVVMNILGNGIYAAEKSGRPPKATLKTYETPEWIVIEISDNGTGIPPHAQAKIFDPFFTTKPVGEGTGLGLSISFNIMQEHDGKLEFKTGNEGTTFFISLPIKKKG